MEADLEQNIKDRQEAEELFELAFDGHHSQRFWETVRDLAIAKMPPPKEKKDPLPPMPDSKAIYFEGVTMPFGKYVGKQIGCVPISYLIWLSEEDRFDRQLLMYLKSDRGKQRIRDEQE